MSIGRVTQSMPQGSHHKASFPPGEAFLASGALVLKLLLRWLWLHLRHLFGFIAQARCFAPGDCQVPPQGRFAERGEALSLHSLQLLCLYLQALSQHGSILQNEWRQLGVQQSRGWVHYAIHRPEPHIMLFRCHASARAYLSPKLFESEHLVYAHVGY